MPITQKQADDRIKQKLSIMCADYNSTKQIAMKFSGYYPDMDTGKYGEEWYYPHFHIHWLRGDPHIWFYHSIH